jgi:hypothetical protein
MNHIFFVAGPLHLLSTYEIIKKKNLQEYYIIIHLNKNKMVNDQMKNTCRFLNLKNFSYLYLSNLFIYKHFQRLIFIFNLKKKFSSTQLNFVISNFNNSFYHYLRIFFSKANFFLIDDGMGTIVAYKLYLGRGIYFPIYNFSKFNQKFLEYFFSSTLRSLLYSKIFIFSFFNEIIKLKKNSINNLIFLKKKLKNSNINKSLVYFSGTKLSERGAISLDEELSILTDIKSYWEKRGKKIIYFAKRTTSKKKLILIKKKLLIDYRQYNIPIELALASKLDPLPYAICSHSSTTLVTLSKIYNIKSYIFVPQKLKKKIYGNLQEYYSFRKYSKIVNI